MYDVANKGFHEQSLKLNRVVQFDSLSGVAANDCSKTMDLAKCSSNFMDLAVLFF